jgi:hypothetical protein
MDSVIERKIANCLALAYNPNASEWAKNFWKKTAEKLAKRLDNK